MQAPARVEAVRASAFQSGGLPCPEAEYGSSPMKRPAVLILLLCVSLHAVHSEEKPPLAVRVKEFVATYKTPDAIDAKLKEWSEQEPQNPDPYVFAANAYLAAADSVSITTGTKRPGFAIVDPKTKKTVGTISDTPDPRLQMKGEAILATAAGKFPHRLDIHVGRMSICERAGDMKALEHAALAMLDAVATQGDKLRWIDDAPLTVPLEQKVAGEIHGRIRLLYSKEKPDTDKAGHGIAVAALKLYPKNVKLLNLAAVFHSYNKEWEQARALLVKASESDPDDIIVLMNIAMTSVRMKDTADARTRFEAIIKKAPDSEQARDAREELKKLKAPAPKKR